MADPRDLLDEGLARERGGDLEHALKCYRAVESAAVDPSLRVRALIRISHTERKRSAWVDAMAAAKKAADIAEESGLADERASALNAEAAVHHARGDFEPAEELYEGVLATTTDPGIQGRALQNLGVLAALQGELDQADHWFFRASRAFSRAGDEAGEAFVLNNYTALALDRKEYEEAESRALRALDAAKRVGDLEVLGHARLNHAETLLGLGDLDRAESEATEALGYFDTSGNTWRRILCLRVLGDVSRAAGSEDLARRFYERALRDARRIGAGADITALEKRLDQGGEGSG